MKKRNQRSLLFSRNWLTALMMSLCSAAFAETIELELQITANGAHPSNGQWDGTRIYYLPFEVSNISPPDIVVVVVQPGYVRWYTRGEFTSLCPDADQCKLDRVRIDTNHPVGVVVFDHDPILEFVLDPGSKGMELAAEQLNGLAAYSAGKQWNRISSWIGKGTSWLDSLQADVQYRSDKSYDWMDSVILLPGSLENTAEIREVEDRMREITRDAIRPKLLTREKARIGGPIEYALLDNCLWPAPACNQPYVSIALMQKDGGGQ